MSQSDMPFTSSGLTPDIIVNPHSFPKRMTIGQLYEGGLSKICAKRGIMCDGTVFRNIEPNRIIEEMRALKMDYYGRERLFTGTSGYWMDSMIFTTPIYYQRLQKFVAKMVYSIDVGPTDIITRQPLDGKANQGGLRISELQRDVLLAHGCARFFSEKFFTDSDDFEVYVCRCGSRAIVNQQIGIYECPECKDDADIYAVYSSWSSKQFLMELNAMHVGTQFKLDPFTFYD
jgi:DNA-directed RNA polymerase beta subunit